MKFTPWEIQTLTLGVEVLKFGAIKLGDTLDKYEELLKKISELNQDLRNKNG